MSRYVSTLLAVSDMARSRSFYHDILGLKVTADFGANVVLEGGIALQTAESWRDFIGAEEITFLGNACELYFEEHDMDGFLSRLAGFPVEYVHPPLERAWGQRVVRFYDPDNHIIEVGEDMTMVVRRFRDGGMTPEEIALRMDVPLSYVNERLSQ